VGGWVDLDMVKYLSVLLVIGFSWGKGLWLANTSGDTVVIIKREKFILNGRENMLLNVDYQNQTLIVDKGLMWKEKKIKFESIRSIRYMKKPFNILPVLILGVPSLLLYKKSTTANDYIVEFFLQGVSITSAGIGILTSIVANTYSKKIILDKNKWAIVND